MYHRNPFLNLLVWIFTGFGTWGERFRHSNNLLTSTHTEIINAVADREKLKTELHQVKLQLANEKQEHQLQMTKERANWNLQMEQDKSRFNLEREQTVSREKLAQEQTLLRHDLAAEEKIKRAQLSSDETLIMKKLEFEQKIKQAHLDKDTALLVIKEEYARKETALHTELHATMYKKLNEALMTMSQEGDKNTKFVHEIMMKIFDKAPAMNSFETINKNYTGQLPPGKTIEVEVTK